MRVQVVRPLLRSCAVQKAFFSPRIGASRRLIASRVSTLEEISRQHASTSRATLHSLSRPLPTQTSSSGKSVAQLRRSLTSAPSTAQRQIADLPDKVALKTGPLGRISKIISPRESTKITTRVGSSFGGNHSLSWSQTPRNILFVKKRNDAKAARALENVARHVQSRYPDMNILIERDDCSPPLGDETEFVFIDEGDKAQLASKVDLVVTLGGDGTILHVSSLFDRDAVPPVLSFSMGTLGFLLPYHIDSFEAAFDDAVHSRVSLLLRMRLQQTTHEADGSIVPSQDGYPDEIHLMNEVALHRASSPHMTMVDAFVDGRHLTQAISDGLIIATPTGSTAYSLSAGGPIVHPSCQSLVLTPICPRSLSFRTVLFPSDASIQLKVSPKSRAAAQVSVDGREIQSLHPGQFLQVSMSPYPIPCINRVSSTARHGATRRQEPVLVEHQGEKCQSTIDIAHSERGEDDWVGDINTLLRFNASFEGRGLLGGNGSHED